ncbi:flagellar biosynthesis protein FlhB [Brevundimonas sp. 2R-24]|uniref:Flagellar biosynthetic protein FlhB n=1 Tax=Peiella sedimenti TaxID=3061083 RepID=A0ABT8SKZ2_9CAUL|nr:flagellar biosynthesis protein FlhB [Caulobacteraceae bacterium XZ-24]
MAEDPESKTEEATPRKLEEARKKGDVAKSPDVSSWLSLAGATAVIGLGGPFFVTQMAEGMMPFIASPHAFVGALSSGAGPELTLQTIWPVLPFLAAIAGATILGGAGGSLIQSGLLWTTEKLKPDLKRLNPIEGFKRLFGIDGQVQFLKTLLKLIATLGIAWWALEPYAADLPNLAAMDPAAQLPFAQEVFIRLIAAVLVLLGVLAGADWLWQRFRFAKKMRMSREELKEDFKQSEGDPHVKARLKQIRAERSRKRMMANVPKATVVITNPTHYAVALRYEPGEDAAPVCVAKGVDTLALKIREVAAAHGVPLVEDVPLARALYAAIDVDETIPRQHFEAVAKIIGFVFARKQGRRAGG